MPEPKARAAVDEFPEAVAQMSDPDQYDAIPKIPYSQAHKCEVTGCNISQEEHHRLMLGVLAENKDMRQRLRVLEGQVRDATDPESR